MTTSTPTVVVTVSPAGDVAVEVQGCPGPSCRKLSADVERALGRTSSDVSTPDLHRVAGARQGVNRGQ